MSGTLFTKEDEEYWAEERRINMEKCKYGLLYHVFHQANDKSLQV
jgi:hypothetical protein